MKKSIIFILLIALGSFMPKLINAQGFAVEHHIVYIPYFGVTSGQNRITPSTTNVTVLWKVIACDFPGDWLNNATVFCDNNLCWPLPNLWPSGMLVTSAPYLPGIHGPFRYYIDLTNATTYGTHYIKLQLANNAAYSTTETYIIRRFRKIFRIGTLTMTPVSDKHQLTIQYSSVDKKSSNDDPSIIENTSVDNNTPIEGHPNSISIYDLSGKLILSKPMNGNTITIDIDKLTSEIYIIDLLDKDGEIIATEKYSKE